MAILLERTYVETNTSMRGIYAGLGGQSVPVVLLTGPEMNDHLGYPMIQAADQSGKLFEVSSVVRHHQSISHPVHRSLACRR